MSQCAAYAMGPVNARGRARHRTRTAAPTVRTSDGCGAARTGRSAIVWGAGVGALACAGRSSIMSQRGGTPSGPAVAARALGGSRAQAPDAREANRRAPVSVDGAAGVRAPAAGRSPPRIRRFLGCRCARSLRGRRCITLPVRKRHVSGRVCAVRVCSAGAPCTAGGARVPRHLVSAGGRACVVRVGVSGVPDTECGLASRLVASCSRMTGTAPKVYCLKVRSDPRTGLAGTHDRGRRICGQTRDGACGTARLSRSAHCLRTTAHREPS